MKKRFMTSGKIILTFLIFGVLLSMGTMLASMLGDESQSTYLLISTVAMMLAPILTYTWFERKNKWSMGIQQSSAVKSTGQGFAVGIVLISFSFLVIWLFNGLHINSIQYDSNTLMGVGIGFGLFILVALSEELLFRGYIQGLLRTQYGRNVGIIYSSILFALAHMMNPGILSTPFPLINIFLIGVFFAVTRELTGGIWLPIGFHLSWNFFQGNFYGFAVSGTETKTIISISPQGHSFISGGEFGAEGSILATLIILIACILAIRKFKSKTKSTHVTF
ncbi:membrane protease YdiL (CAAX protease family) [Paenibacillus sp. DS2015]|uniref:CPBP family intramembrane glutamic endopeptidase n=1 Tax=Paenibacillus sp. DS2015 TaxID=3373917 RepID=UPI003D243A3C